MLPSNQWRALSSDIDGEALASLERAAAKPLPANLRAVSCILKKKCTFAQNKML
jgi:hypothetical protein